MNFTVSDDITFTVEFFIQHSLQFKNAIKISNVKPYNHLQLQYSIYYEMLNRTVNFITNTSVMVLDRLNSSESPYIMMLHIAQQLLHRSATRCTLEIKFTIWHVDSFAMQCGLQINCSKDI